MIRKYLPGWRRSDIPSQSWCIRILSLPLWWCSAWEPPQGDLRSHLRWGPLRRETLRSTSRAVPKQSTCAMRRQHYPLKLSATPEAETYLPFYLSFHGWCSAPFPWCWIYMPANGGRIQNVYFLSNFKKTNLFNWNINLCIIHNWTNIKKY